MSKVTIEQLRDIVKDAVKQQIQPLQEKSTAWAEKITVPAEAKAPAVKGEKFSRFVRAIAASKGNKEAAQRFAGEVLKDDIVAKALGATVGNAGGYLVPPDISSDIIEILRSQAVVRAMNPNILDMPNGNLTLNGGANGATASYVSEGVNITTSQPTFRQVNLSARKLVALVPISNDLLRFASANADAFVRNDLVNALAERQDLAFIRGDGTGNTPKGFRFLATTANVITANATVNLANVTTDLGKLELALLSANIKMRRPGWIVAPRVYVYLTNLRDGNGNLAFPEMSEGKLRGYPIKWTTQIPANLGGSSNESEIYFVDFDNVVIGDAQGLIIDASETAAYTENSVNISTFQRDETLIRAIQQHDIDVRQDATIAVLTAVTWGA